MAERLAELCTKAAVVPQYCEYAQPAPAPSQRFAGAWAPQPYDRADLAERMAELAAKESARLALAALEDSLAYAQPGRPEKKVSCLGQLLDFWSRSLMEWVVSRAQVAQSGRCSTRRRHVRRPASLNQQAVVS